MQYKRCSQNVIENSLRGIDLAQRSRLTLAFGRPAPLPKKVQSVTILINGRINALKCMYKREARTGETYMIFEKKAHALMLTQP